ncbi:MAG TPA: alpha/beta fold hydrolase [Kofleriaceae bacterium]|nr:alpha/beta fold hydrolase [Kofleriaceae bacterium]
MTSNRSEKSTTVRSTLWALRRAAIRTLHQLAPARAADVAARWFVTPSRPATARAGAEVARREAAHAGDAAGRAIDPGTPLVLTDGRLRLAARSWGTGATALLVHGWNGRGAQLAPIARALAARGYRAVAFDHPAHGDSRGRTVTIPEMADAIQMVSEQLGGVQALVAHSLGAVAATLALSRGGLRPERAAFLAPPLDPEEWVTRFGRALGLPASADGDLIAAIEARAGMSVSALRPLALAPALSTELLIVHDRGDREVPLENGEALAQAWPGAHLVTTDGLGHRRLLASPGVVELVAEFIGDPPADRFAARVPGAPRDRHFAAIVDQILAS